MTQANENEAPFAEYGPVTSAKLSRFQTIVAARLSHSANSIPHVTHHDDIDVTNLEEARLRPGAKSVSPLIFAIKAVVEALKAFPSFNSSFGSDQKTLIQKHYYHIGVAVDGPLGLLVPVLRDCDTKSINELSQEMVELTAQARAKGLPLETMSGGCFTVSSLGGIGGTAFTPIINPPEVAILGITRTQTKPVWNGTTFVPRQMMPLSLSYDHRVINGADAARFVRHIARAIEGFAPLPVSPSC